MNLEKELEVFNIEYTLEHIILHISVFKLVLMQNKTNLHVFCNFYPDYLKQAHNDLLKTYEAKLQQFGVPPEELGFKPLESTVGGQQLGHGPAGLVSAPS